MPKVIPWRPVPAKVWDALQRRTIEHPSHPGNGVVYVLRDAVGNTKIGLSSYDAGSRTAVVAKSVPYERRPVTLYRALHIDQKIAGLVEREAHRRLCERAIGGEWFSCGTRTAFKTVLDAAEYIIAGNRYAWRRPRGHVSVKGKRGYRAVEFSEHEWERFEAIWCNVKKYPTWVECEAAFKAINPKMNRWRAHARFRARVKPR